MIYEVYEKSKFLLYIYFKCLFTNDIFRIMIKL